MPMKVYVCNTEKLVAREARFTSVSWDKAIQYSFVPGH